MKPELHPAMQAAAVPARGARRVERVHCGCGNEFETLSTVEEIRVDICANCHPFFTGEERFVDTEGRVESFERRYGKKKK